MSAREWHVTIGKNHAYVRGYGTREQLTRMKGRAPVWATRERAWVCQPSTAKDLLAIAERRRIGVVLVEEHPDVTVPGPATPPPESGLW